MRAWDGRQDEHQRSAGIRGNSTTCPVPAAAANVPRQCEDSSVVANIPSHDWGASAMWTRTGLFGLESFSVGGDYRHYQGAFDEVDFNTTCPGANCGRVVRTIWSGGDQGLSGAFVQAIAAPLKPLRIEMSARVDQWVNNNARSVDATAGTTNYTDRTRGAFSPRVGARYDVSSRISLHGAVYRAFRAPNLAELYRKQISPTQITLPNPDLAAETAFGREIGLEVQPLDWVQVKGTYYVADYRDFNVPVTLSTTGGVTTRQRKNINRSRSDGAEVYVALRPVPQLFVSASAMYDNARQQSGLPAGTTSDHKPHINRVPSPRQTIRATYTSSLLGAWTAIWRHEGHTTTLQGAWLDPFTVVDANVRRQLVRGVDGFVSVENVTDERYQINQTGTGTAAVLSWGMPRTIRAGLNLHR